ncbi:hypothetical protein C0583_02435 [Candidatus Parcubacteria bacterium]|nr:MAG: hypothetical protein C0583_02435 [Candidatus Parcubacteria bacterium]
MVEAKSKKAEEKKSVAERVSTKAIDNTIYGVIALIFFLCPIFFTGVVAQGIAFEKMAIFYFLVLLGAVLWVTKGVFKGELDIKRTPLDYPILATFVLFALSTIFSISQKDSFIGAYGSPAKGLIAFIVFALFFFLVVNNIDKKRVRLYFTSFAASMFLLALYSFFQLSGWFVLPFSFSKVISFNPIGSLSGLTMALTIALPILTILAAKTEMIFAGMKNQLVILIKLLSIIAVLLSLYVLGVLNLFTFWPAVIISSVIVLMFFMAKIIPINTGNLMITLLVFLASVIFFVMGNFSVSDLQLPTEISLSRGASWNIAKASIMENPVFGSGPSTFYYSFSKFKSPEFNGTQLWNVRFDSASSSFFELLATVGALGTLAVSVVVLIVFSLIFLTLIKTKENDSNPIMLGMFASFIAMVLLSLLFAQENSVILLNVLVAVLSIAIAITIYPEKFANINLSFRAAPKYALALAAIFLSVSAGVVVLFTMGLKTYMADMYAKDALLTGQNAKKIELLNKSISLAPYQDKYYLSLANAYMAQANQAVIDGKDASTISSVLSQSIDSGKKAIEIAPKSASNNESLALIYENASFYTRGALEWAEKLYNELIVLEPTNPTPYMRIALVNMARANSETDQEEKKYYINEALKYYDKSIEKKSYLAAAHYGKAVAYEKLSDMDQAIEEMKSVNLIAGTNIDYRFELGRLLFNRGIANAGIKQTAEADIATNDIDPETGEPLPADELSVEGNTSGEVVEKNDDLIAAEQVFLSILTVSQNHANALYSLAVLYDKIGETDNLKAVVTQLLQVVTDPTTKAAIQQQFPNSF